MANGQNGGVDTSAALAGELRSVKESLGTIKQLGGWAAGVILAFMGGVIFVGFGMKGEIAGLTEMKDDVRALKEELKDASIATIPGEIKNLRAIADKTQRDMSSMQAETMSLRSDIGTLATKSDVEATVRELQTSVSNAANQFEQLVRQLPEDVGKLNGLPERFESARKDLDMTIAKLSDLGAVKDEVASLRGSVAETTAKVATIQRDIASLTDLVNQGGNGVLVASILLPPPEGKVDTQLSSGASFRFVVPRNEAWFWQVLQRASMSRLSIDYCTCAVRSPSGGEDRLRLEQVAAMLNHSSDDQKLSDMEIVVHVRNEDEATFLQAANEGAVYANARFTFVSQRGAE